MNKQKIFTFSKIGGILLLSFVLVKFILGDFFVGTTPQLVSNPQQVIALKFSEFLNPRTNFLTKVFFQVDPEKKLKDVPFTIPAPGIYAKQKDNMSYTLIKESEVTYIEYTFNVKGKEIKIKVPQGQQPPSQQLVEELNK